MGRLAVMVYYSDGVGEVICDISSAVALQKHHSCVKALLKALEIMLSCIKVPTCLSISIHRC